VVPDSLSPENQGTAARARKRRIRWMLLILGLLGGILFLEKIPILSSPEKSPPQPFPGETRPAPVIEKAAPPLPPDRLLAGKIAKGQSLSHALRAQELPADLAAAICGHLQPLVNLRKIKPGDTFEVRLRPGGEFLSFTFSSGPLDVYQLTSTPSGDWIAMKKDVPVEKYWVRISGEISSSLFEAMDQLGEADALIMDFADLFAWEIDFHSDPQPGDRFVLVVEKYYVQESFVKYGRILYAEYQSENRKHQAFFFQPPGERGDYYTPKGESLRKALLRSPLKFTRISSGYSKSRRHPILGGIRPHLGVDYAAPTGSPVWAVADGTVVFCGWNGGYGKQIIIRHPKGYQSMYGHLSSFARGMKKGKNVQQKQVIGYVGSTGLATGPHLDFRLLKNGVYRNPLKEISPRAAPLSPAQLAEFPKAIEPLLSWQNDSSAPQKQKVGSFLSRDLENAGVERRREP
jgi:murein DD-endopeptidase MepM/ murein hydrolase activator NlpD